MDQLRHFIKLESKSKLPKKTLPKIKLPSYNIPSYNSNMPKLNSIIYTPKTLPKITIPQHNNKLSHFIKVDKHSWNDGGAGFTRRSGRPVDPTNVKPLFEDEAKKFLSESASALVKGTALTPESAVQLKPFVKFGGTHKALSGDINRYVEGTGYKGMARPVDEPLSIQTFTPPPVASSSGGGSERIPKLTNPQEEIVATGTWDSGIMFYEQANGTRMYLKNGEKKYITKGSTYYETGPGGTTPTTTDTKTTGTNIIEPGFNTSSGSLQYNTVGMANLQNNLKEMTGTGLGIGIDKPKTTYVPSSETFLNNPSGSAIDNITALAKASSGGSSSGYNPTQQTAPKSSPSGQVTQPRSTTVTTPKPATPTTTPKPSTTYAKNENVVTKLIMPTKEVGQQRQEKAKEVAKETVKKVVESKPVQKLISIGKKLFGGR